MWAWFFVAVARVRSVLRPDDLDRDFDRELDAHLAMAAEDKVRQGMTPADARRIARVELGGVMQLREAGRAARGLAWLDSFGLDVRLGLRMLRKSWGLTLAGGLALTVAIAIAAGLVNIHQVFFGITVPLDEGDRVIALVNWNARANEPQSVSARDLGRWSELLRSVEDLGAFRTTEHHLDDADGADAPVTVAAMTASGFRLARVPPLLGRPLLAADERDGAAPVVVIGHEAWRTRFASDPAVVGRRVGLDSTPHTIVGVMPQGFAFPVNHQFWIPLRIDPSEASHGSSVFAFGRLAPDVTLERAQAELSSVGLLPSLAVREADEQLDPRVVPYALAITGNDRSDASLFVRVFLLVAALLLIPPAANVAILVYARTVARQEEFHARHALGASRARIVVQIFIEVLVLAAASALAGLVLVRFTGGYLQSTLNLRHGMPFWFDFRVVTFDAVMCAAGFALAAAVIAGVLPALQATGRMARSGLRVFGGRTTPAIGTTWIVLVILQVAFSIAVLPPAAELAWGTVRPVFLGPGFGASEYLTGRLVLDRAEVSAAFGATQTELIRRLRAEPGVTAVAASAAVPGLEPDAGVSVAAAGVLRPEHPDALEGPATFLVADVNRVDTAFFGAFAVPLVGGRTFEPGDFDPSSRAVVVSRTMGERLSEGGGVLGRRIRYSRAPAGLGLEGGTEYEVVGVIGDLPENTGRFRIYHPMAHGQLHPATIAIRSGLGVHLAPRLREMAAALNPVLRLEEVAPLHETYRRRWRARYLGALMMAGVALSVLLLSAMGMHALMSFTVAERRREIGIRSALGAPPNHLLLGVFRRTIAQVAGGAAAGMVAAYLLGRVLPIRAMGGEALPGVLPAAATVMLLVAVLAAAGPVRRALSIEPNEAVRES